MLDLILRLYYPAKRFLPRRLQLALRRPVVAHKLRKHGALWPINPATASSPPGWTGWPEGKRFALVLTHDVESQRGVDRVLKLADLEERLGFRSSFNFVAEDYSVPSSLREELERRGFEVGLHGLTHDGSLYHSRKEFLEQATRINDILQEWNVVGFRSPCMYHNLEWLHDLDIEYDASTFDTDPFEPQPDALGTIFPLFIPNSGERRGYVELPYTLPQDLHVFVLMNEKSINIWKKKLRWISENGGLALVTTHPDYMHLGDRELECDEYPVELYAEFLQHILKTYAGAYWAALPKELARFWKANHMADESMSTPATICLDDPETKSLSIPAARRTMKMKRPHPRSETNSCSETIVTDHTRVPLKVCMVAYTFYENDNRVKRYAEALAGRGDEVDVIALKRGNQPGAEKWKGVNLHRIQKRVVNEKAKLTYFFRLLAFLFRSFWFLTRRHLAHPYDLIHVHNVPDFHVFAALVPKLTGAKVILDIHDILPEFYASKFCGRGDEVIFGLLRLVEKGSCAFSDHVIVSNHIWMDRLHERSVEPSKCTTLINYPDPSIFHAGTPTDGHTGFSLLYPGTLNHHQGLDVAIRAFARIKAKLPGAEFHIYGEGPETENLKCLAAELGVQNQVLFHGVISMEDVAQVMARADLGIVPKRANGFGDEAFSTKILEFMALGVPVVASETRIDRYYFNDSLLRFFKSEDEQDLANAVLALAGDESLRKALSAGALRFISDNNWQVKRYLYYDLVDQLVKPIAAKLQNRAEIPVCFG